MSKENIIVIGFMGCGKTTVGKRIAKELEYQFVDTDAMIEEQEGMTISEIFQIHGESYFRSLETKLLTKLHNSLEHAVVSTGGGLPIRDENAELLKELGCVIYLKVEKETVLHRLKGDTTRPLLAGADADKKVGFLLKERVPKYEKASHWQVNVDKLTLSEVCQKVVNCYKTSHYPKKRVY